MVRIPRPLSARTRILAAVLAVACVGLTLVGSVTFLVQREMVLTEIDDRLAGQAESLLSVAESEDDVAQIDDLATVEEFLRAAMERTVPSRNEAALAILDGTTLIGPGVASGIDISGDGALIARILSGVESGVPVAPKTAVTPEGTLRYIALPVSLPADPSRGVVVRAVELGAALRPVASALVTYGITAVAVLAAIGVVGWFVTGRLLSPIRRLRETADAITLTDLSPRLPAEGTDDISDLNRTVNSMLDRLEGSVDVQRQLLDDVRHELKTPITIVRGHLEMMDPRDASDVTSIREISIAELDRMTRLVEDIDLLAAVEGDSFAMGDVDLALLTARIGELVAVIPGHRWRIDEIADATIAGDADRLLQAWLQLADNAAKYTPAGSPIELGSTWDAAGARLYVRDHGGGIPHASRHRIFRRFDRAEGARLAGGSGLGLAIVDAIAKGHDGYCAVTDTPGGGATFTIHVPPQTAELPAPVRAGDVLQRESST
ncbi:HAMP domain-containing sensor histidine kinase [Microbacterium invictum]|uniref:histidine kinase n=1 Tax=Microbacterium invictum TaxID=515415 RepID=A0ABZ0VHQ9_9MICO|nr:HAMP domain-containing sensor histidine kinase [Microbacterium invictum]WQB71745.1 HAMP domain-containing sensor histidine kinase [Microbacterium invictum]